MFVVLENLYPTTTHGTSWTNTFAPQISKLQNTKRRPNQGSQAHADTDTDTDADRDADTRNTYTHIFRYMFPYHLQQFKPTNLKPRLVLALVRAWAGRFHNNDLLDEPEPLLPLRPKCQEGK